MYVSFTPAFLQAQADQAFRVPDHFVPVALGLLVAGTLVWIVAAALGFSRARDFGPSARWFAAASMLLVLHHLFFVILGLGVIGDPDLVLSLGAFFNLFVALAGLCAIVGFLRLTDPGP